MGRPLRCRCVGAVDGVVYPEGLGRRGKAKSNNHPHEGKRGVVFRAFPWEHQDDPRLRSFYPGPWCKVKTHAKCCVAFDFKGLTGAKA